MAHRQAEVVNLYFNTEFRVFHPLWVRQWASFTGNVAAFLAAIKRIVDFAKRVHGLEFNQRR
ncbi:MAG: hypothetical protein DMG56_14310 [Acidobacteria bacterium]|nr:MAG: hypothetical protein DMG54_22915 [Acidobacteriota bacterium]PYU60987.1 MAG: hypothetical protein DMG56_14310 [Acidobacteriota bacterium]PYU71852.1 MAG: hypothetical protein DMG52_21015 [Acidobacteriota bacterium]